jgi:hypothetical protein
MPLRLLPCGRLVARVTVLPHECILASPDALLCCPCFCQDQTALDRVLLRGCECELTVQGTHTECVGWMI